VGQGENNNLTTSRRRGFYGLSRSWARHCEIVAETSRSPDNGRYICIYYRFVDTCGHTYALYYIIYK
jgi:hypothetical protein